MASQTWRLGLKGASDGIEPPFRQLLSLLILGHFTARSSALIEASNASLEASNALLEASSGALEAWNGPLEAWLRLLEASRVRSITSNGLIEASISLSELPEDPPHSWNASLEASSGAFQLRSAAALATSGALQARRRPPPTFPGVLVRTTAAVGTSAAPRLETVATTLKVNRHADFQTTHDLELRDTRVVSDLETRRIGDFRMSLMPSRDPHSHTFHTHGRRETVPRG